MTTLSLFAPPRPEPIRVPPRPVPAPQPQSAFAMRDYQRRAVDNICGCLRDEPSTLLVCATGCGKTVMIAHAIREFLPPDKRAIVLAHRQELIEQNARTIHAVLGEPIGIEMGDVWADQGPRKHRVIVASKDSLHAKRRARFDPSDFGLVIVDEAHHSPAASYRDVFDHFDGVPLLGVTATPDRTDEEALGQVFASVAMIYEITDAIKDGYLVPVRANTVFVESLNLADVHTTAGDFNVGELSAQLESERTMYEIAASIQREAAKPHNVGRRGLIFTASVRQATRLSEILNDHVPDSARWASGETPREERAQILQDHKAGAFRWLVNCALFCLDEDTEILTSDGWVGIDAMTMNHRVANWSNDGTVFFQKPKSITRRRRFENERMVVLETPRKSIRVTEDHRMLFGGNSGPFKIVNAKNCVNRIGSVPNCGVAEPLSVEMPKEKTNRRNEKTRITQNAHLLRKNNGYGIAESRIEAARRVEERNTLRYKKPEELTPDECELIGFWLGDGSACHLHSGGIEYTLAQSLSAMKICDRVDRLLKSCGIDYRRTTRKAIGIAKHDNYIWHFSRGTGFGNQKRNGVYHLEPYLKKDGTPLFFGLNEKQFFSLMRGLWMADGNHGDSIDPPKRINACGVNWSLFSILQAVAVCRGWRCTINRAASVAKPHHIPILRLTMSKRSRHRMTKYRLQFEEGWKDERIWCVTSTTGNIITRRRGTVTVTGNTEGYDDPGLGFVVLARPTKSRSLFAQMLGRGTRPLPGVVDGLPDSAARRAAIAGSAKPYISILDFTGVSGRHKLITPADVLGGNYSQDDIDAASKILAGADGMDVAEALEDAKQAREARKENDEETKRVAAIVGNRHKIMALAQYMLTPQDLFGGAVDYVPRERDFQRGKSPTEAQIATLERAGFGRLEVEQLSRQECSKMISQIILRREMGLATLKQCRALGRRGIKTDGMTFEQASATMDRLYGGSRR